MDKIIKINIHRLMAEHKISLRELGRRADIGHGILSNLANQKRQAIHLDHLTRISSALNIHDLNKLMELKCIGPCCLEPEPFD